MLAHAATIILREVTGNGVIILPNGPYVPWDVGVFGQGVALLRQNIGVVITVGFWAFLIISTFYLVIKVANSLIG